MSFTPLFRKIDPNACTQDVKIVSKMEPIFHIQCLEKKLQGEIAKNRNLLEANQILKTDFETLTQAHESLKK